MGAKEFDLLGGVDKYIWHYCEDNVNVYYNEIKPEGVYHESGGLYLASLEKEGGWVFEASDSPLKGLTEHLDYVKSTYMDCLKLEGDDEESPWEHGYLHQFSEFYLEFDMLHLRIVSTLVGDMDQPYWVEKQPQDLIREAKGVLFEELY